MADITESPKLLTSIIKELQDNNHVNELIFDSVETLNTSLTTDVQGEYNIDIFTQILERINGIHKNIFNFLDIFASSDLQDEENRRELLATLKGLGKKDTNRDSKMVAGPGGILGVLTGLVGFVSGMVYGFVGKLAFLIAGVWKNSVIGRSFTFLKNTITDGIKSLYTKIVTSFKNTKTVKSITEFSKNLNTTISNFFTAIKTGIVSKFNAGIGTIKGFLNKSNIFKTVVSKIKSFYTPFVDLFKAIGEFLPKGQGLVSGIKGFITSISDKFAAVASKFSAAFNIGKMFGGLLAKLALPLTIIMGLWDTVTGAIAGYKKDGVEGAIKGGLSGLLNGLVGGILDMIKGGISWIAGALGFDKVEKLLDSFSFSSIIESFVGGLVDFTQSIFDLMLAPFTTIPKMLKEAVKSISTKGFEGIFEFPKIVLRAVLPDPEKHTSLFDPLYWTAKAIPDSIYEYAGLRGGNTNNAPSDADQQQKKLKQDEKETEKLKEEEIKRKKIIDRYDVDKDGKLGLGETLSRVGDSATTWLESKGATILNNTDTKSTEIYTALPQNISSPSIERPQNNTGSILNQSSQSTLAMPVIVNNYGGNITNNTTSRVNNTQAIYDPIVTGSNLSLTNR